MVLAVGVNGIIDENAYFYIDEKTNGGFLIDPGAEAERLLSIIEKRRFSIEKILLTHGHFDHIGAVGEIQNALNIPVCMQKNGRQYASDARMNLSRSCGLDIVLDDVVCLENDSEIKLATNETFSLRLIAVPGHTADGAMYYDAKNSVAFVGDTIFRGSFGRTDFYGGDEETLFRSIKTKILTLPDDTVLLSGHSEPTTVGEEKTRPWYM